MGQNEKISPFFTVEKSVQVRSPFAEQIKKRQESADTLLCIGLDPVLENIPVYFQEAVIGSFLSEDAEPTLENIQYDFLIKSGQIEDSERLIKSVILEEFDKVMVDETYDLVSGYKPNIAFYERYAEFGMAALRRVIKYIRSIDKTIPVILDAKRADIGATNEGYVEMVDAMGADAVTVNPYFGIEGKGALDPFLDMKNTGLIILCRTSNPEAKEMQDSLIEHGKYGFIPNYMRVAYMAEEARQKNPNVSIVVGATAPEQLEEVRKIFKGNILIPALGKQGGKPEDLFGAFDENELGIIPNNASAIIHASKENDFAQAARKVAMEWRDNINKIRVPDVTRVVENMTFDQLRLAEMMLTAEVDGKLTRRDGEVGAYTYEKEEGKFPMITIAQNEHEFVGAANLKDPQNPDIPLLDYFVNLRGGTAGNYEVMADVLAEIEFPFEFDYITGIPNTGNAIAKALAEKLGVPYFEILEKTSEGIDRQFTVRRFEPDEAKPEPGMKALLVDDLITGAVTKIAGEETMENGGFEVAGQAVVYDREEGGMDEMIASGRKIVAGITATEVFAVASTEGESQRSSYKKIVRKNIQKRIARSLSS